MGRCPLSAPEAAVFAAEWTRCRPWIEAANAYGRGTHDIEDIRAAVLAGEAQFWPGRRSALVTEIHTFPRLKALHFWLCGGDLRELTREMRPVVEAWGRSIGCTRFTTAGREGWRRVMARHGYAPVWHICSKEARDE